MNTTAKLLNLSKVKYSNLYPYFIFALQNRQLIEFDYHNKKRICEVYCYGLINSSELLLCYQINDQSGYRLFKTFEIENLKVLDSVFEIREDYTVNCENWTFIYLKV